MVFVDGVPELVKGYYSRIFTHMIDGKTDKPWAICRATKNAARRAKSANKDVYSKVVCVNVPFVGTVAVTATECERLGLIKSSPIDYLDSEKSKLFAVEIAYLESSLFHFASYEDVEAWLSENMSGLGEVTVYRLEKDVGQDGLPNQWAFPTRRSMLTCRYKKFFI